MMHLQKYLPNGATLLGRSELFIENVDLSWIQLYSRFFYRQIRSTETPLSQYKFLFDQLKKISILHSTLTPEPSYGEIADETAQRLLNVETASSSIEIQEVVIYLTNQSIDFVRDRFGPNSTEYAWELVKKRSVAKAFGLPGNDEDIMSFRRIIIVHYGEREAEKILKEKKLRYIFQ